MENKKLIEQISDIQRGLGVIEGIASYLSNDAASQMLYAATAMISKAVKEITNGK